MTAEEKVRMTVGNLVVENIALSSKVEELNKKIAELEQPKDKPAEG
jgi:dynactin complex subunit